MRNLFRHLKITPMLALLTFCFTMAAGCPGCPPTPDSPLGKIVNCDGLGNQVIPLIPKVNDCLTGAVDWKGCLISLINPAANITVQVLSCAVKDQGIKFAEGGDDQLEDTAACAADDFIQKYVYQEQGLSFADNDVSRYETPSGVTPDVCNVLLQSRSASSP